MVQPWAIKRITPVSKNRCTDLAGVKILPRYGRWQAPFLVPESGRLPDGDRSRGGFLASLVLLERGHLSRQFLHLRRQSGQAHQMRVL